MKNKKNTLKTVLKNPKNQKITLIIPTYNEVSTVGDIIKRSKPFVDEIIIVDSIKSKDNMEKIAKKFNVKIIKDEGKGKGNALRCGINEVKDGIIVFIDADGSHIPEDIPSIVKPIADGNYDLVIASRFTGGSHEIFDGTMNGMFRTFFTMGIAVVLNWRFRQKILDYENGYRAITAKCARDLKLEANKFDIETEEVMKCLKKGYRITEVPSRELERKDGVAKLSIIGSGFSIIRRIIVNWF